MAFNSRKDRVLRVVAGEAGGRGGMAQPLAKLGGDAKVKYVSWDFKKLLEYFRREPAVAGKVQALYMCIHTHVYLYVCIDFLAGG